VLGESRSRRSRAAPAHAARCTVSTGTPGWAATARRAPVVAQLAPSSVRLLERQHRAHTAARAASRPSTSAVEGMRSGCGPTARAPIYAPAAPALRGCAPRARASRAGTRRARRLRGAREQRVLRPSSAAARSASRLREGARTKSARPSGRRAAGRSQASWHATRCHDPGSGQPGNAGLSPAPFSGGFRPREARKMGREAEEKSRRLPAFPAEQRRVSCRLAGAPAATGSVVLARGPFSASTRYSPGASELRPIVAGDPVAVGVLPEPELVEHAFVPARDPQRRLSPTSAPGACTDLDGVRDGRHLEPGRLAARISNGVRRRDVSPRYRRYAPSCIGPERQPAPSRSSGRG
jgi:hypothetical protein